MLDRIWLLVAGLAVAWAAFSSGGVTPGAWNVCLIVVCVLSLVVCLQSGGLSRRFADVPLIALPAYVALQLIPLPLRWLDVLSPARAAIVRAGTPLGLDTAGAPLTVSPTLTMAHLERLLCFVCLFFLVRELTRRFGESGWLVAVPVVMVGVLEAVLGLAQYFGGAARATGTYVNPNHFACLLQMALPFPLVMAAALLRRGGRVPLICGLLAVAAIIFPGVLYSLSRMALLTVAVSLVVLALATTLAMGRTRRPAWLLGGALIAMLVFAIFVSTPGALLERFIPARPGDSLTADARIAIWRETLPLIHDYRVFGSGLGTYVSVFQKYRASSPEALVDYAHNDYLQLLAELGVIGFAIAAGAAILILLRIVRNLHAGRSQAARLLSAACLASLVALMLSSAVDFDFYIPANAMLGAWIAGMGAGLEC